jgi:hypothetical protein
MNPLLQKLEGGDRRSVGRVDEVVAKVLADLALFPVLIDGMLDSNPLIRMRAADAATKVVEKSGVQPLQPYKTKLLNEIAPIPQQEVRWHVAQLISRLDLTPAETGQAVAILESYLNDKSKIVKTFAMQTLADLAEREAALRPRVLAQLEHLTATGSPAMQSRGRKLLARLTNLP